MNILANRIKDILNDRIHPDQNGFLPTRQIKNNLRVVMNVMEYYERHPERQIALIFLDAQKAFDQVNWKFMTQQIRKMNFGEKFEKLISLIYTKQKARVLVNGELTESFEIGRGVRQGCPLSPLLFILTLESLLRKIRTNKEIKGLTVKGEEYKVQAFADDLVFFIEEPLTTEMKLRKEIEEFGAVAGLKVNKDKTKMITKNLTIKQKETLERQSGLKIVKKVKYLGVNLTNKCMDIRKNNYEKLIANIEEDLERWGKLKISLLGRIAVMKMNILPKILYFFQTIPVKLDSNFFMKLKKITQKFVWEGKKARIAVNTLQEKRERGGFGLPAWEIYYKATCLTWIREWVNLKNQRVLKLEGHDLMKGWHAYLWNKGDKTYEHFKTHIIRNSLITVWSEIKKKYYRKAPNWLAILEAVMHPKTSTPYTKIRYRDLLEADGTLRTQQELKERGIELDWWTYFQIRSRYKLDMEQGGIELRSRGLDKLLELNGEKLISKIYKFILETEGHDKIIKGQMTAWERNIGRNIDLEDWEKIWERNIKTTKSVTYRENQYKMWYRWHLAPARLAQMYKNMDPKCWKCNQADGTFFHTWWLCPKVKKFWEKVRSWIVQMTEEKIELEPEVFLLGMIKQSIRKEHRYLILHIITAARIVFAQGWKTSQIPTDQQLIQKIYTCAELDQLTLKLKGKEDSKFFKTWEIWYKWIQQKKR